VNKPILCIDFDGVIHSYERGWQDGSIYGTATPGFFAWAIQACEMFQLVVYSSRSSSPEGITAMREWIGTQSVEAIERGEVPGSYEWPELWANLTFADKKPPAFLTIDDRCVRFMGDWGDLMPEQLRAFKPWNMKG
jgi:hypothetical protein